MLSDQREDYGAAYLLEAHPALRLGSGLAAELAVSAWAFPGKRTTGRATLWGAGLRFDPLVGPRLRLVADVHGGLGRTGGHSRFMFDGGLGLEYAVTDRLSLGVFGRYGQVADGHEDPKFAAGGAFVGVAWPEAFAAPRPPEVLRSGEPAGSATPDAGIRLAIDGGAPDGMMADRDANPDSGPSNDGVH